MMKKTAKALILVLIAVLAICLVACTEKTVTVSFELGEDAVAEQAGFEPIVVAVGAEVVFADVKVPEGKEGYQFVGWQTGEMIYKTTDKLVAAEDITLKAVFERKQYTVTFLNSEGEEISAEQVAHGAMPVVPAFNETTFKEYINITDAAQDKFVGWKVGDVDTVPAVATGDITYRASYITIAKSYTVTFVNSEDIEITSAQVEYGTMPMVPAFNETTFKEYINITDAAQDKFAGWKVGDVDTVPAEVTGNVTYRASYTTETRNYTVTFVNGEGEEISTAQVAYGTVPAVPQFNETTFLQYINETVGSHDKFAGWKVDGEIAQVGAVSGEVVYTAYYATEAIETVTVTFDLGDKAAAGEQEKFTSVVLNKGRVFNFANYVAPVAKTGYTFKGWKIGDTEHTVTDKVTIDANTTVNAVFTANLYTVTFENAAGETIATSKVAFEQVPEVPQFNTTTFKEYINVGTETRDKFTGWKVGDIETEIDKVAGDITYKAYYTTEKVPYTLTFKASEYLDWMVNGQVATSIVRDHGTNIEFTVQLKAGALMIDGESFVVKLGQVVLEAISGTYTVTLAADSEVSVEGLGWATYDTPFGYLDKAEVNTVDLNDPSNLNVNYGVERGGSFRFRARGIEKYREKAPKVMYLNNTIAPETSIDGWFVYLIENVTSTNEITVAGFSDYILIQYVQADGSVIGQNWSVSTEGAGLQNSTDAVTGEYFSPNRTTVRKDGVNYAIVTGKIGSWSTYYYLTTDPTKQFVTAEEAAAWVASPTKIVPQKGAENKYYLVYGVKEDAKTTYVFTLPDGYTDLQVKVDGVEKAPMLDYFDGNQGYVPMFGLRNIIIGATLTVSFTLPDGYAYGAYQVGDKRVEAVNGTYTFIVEPELLIWVLETDYVTVQLPRSSDINLYSMSNMGGMNFNRDDQKVTSGADLKLRISFNQYSWQKTESMAQYDAYCDAWSVEGFEVEIIKFETKEKIEIIIKNITADCVLKFTPPPERIYKVVFAVDSNFTYRVDGKDIVPDAGATTVQLDLNIRTSEIILVPTSSSALFKPDALFLYGDDGQGNIEKKQASYSPMRVPNTFNWKVTFGAYRYSPLVEYNHPTATEEQKVQRFTYASMENAWTASHYTNRYDVTKNGGTDLVFTKDIRHNGDFTVSLTAPKGKTPGLYVEFGNKKDLGFKKFEGVKAADKNSFTFTVSNITANIRWYILLDATMYEITFVYNGETLLQTVVPHGTAWNGTSWSDIGGLPTEVEGEKDGLRGIYQVSAWKWSGGGQSIVIDKSGVLEPILGDFTPYQAKINETYYKTVGEAIASLSSYQGLQIVNIDVLATNETPTLAAGQYTIPKNVVLRLPYAAGEYGEMLGTLDNASVMYADLALGTVRLIVPQGANIEVFGTISVGAIVGRPETVRPYQGHISSYYAILQLDGKINLNNGGSLQSYGMVVGGGAIEAFAGGTVYSPFVVKDYRGGSNTTQIFFEGIAPFNLYEMPYVQVEITLHYGASEMAYAKLFADSAYQKTQIEILGSNGLIQPKEGGKIVKKVKMIDNPRYSETTKHREPPFEFRTRLDVYGGGTDGTMQIMGVTTKGIAMAISFVYDIHLHNGVYQQKNAYKIMPGGTLTVEANATLEIVSTTNEIGLLTAYGADFRDSTGGAGFDDRLLYPTITEEGKLIVNGKLKVVGKLGAPVYSTQAGATIEVYAMDTYLFVEQREGNELKNKPLVISYQKVVDATASGVKLEQGGIYQSQQQDDSILWVRSN